MRGLTALRVLLLLATLALCEQFQFDMDTVPFDGAESAQARYDQIAHDSLLWGPYRSGNYLGIRPRLPHSLMSGLIWYNLDSLAGLRKAKHAYEQNHNLGRANWVRFDPRFGGREEMCDYDSHINITIDFVKSDNGRNWAVKVRAVPHKGHENVKTSFVWYLGLEDDTKPGDGPTSLFKLDNAPNPNGYKGTLKLSGFSGDLGMFEMQINDGAHGVKNVHPRVKPLLLPSLDPRLTHHLSLHVPNGNVWQAMEIFSTLLQDCVVNLVEQFGQKTARTIPAHLGLLLRNLNNYEGNLHLVQKVYEGACEFDVTFNEESSPPTEKITFKNIDSRISAVAAKFDKTFDSRFALKLATEAEKNMGKELLSGLLGGLSYFYGLHLVDRTTRLDDDDMAIDESGDTHLPKLNGKSEGPFELFTLVPSRPFFPRGFYWDEGFHLLSLLQYDSDLALDIIKSWFNLIDDEGWIAREQILGNEARSRVPQEFVVQSSSIVNPPTLMLAFTYLLEHLQKPSLNEPIDVDAANIDFSSDDLGLIVTRSPELLASYTKQIYPQLVLHYESFRETQQGTVDDFGREGTTELYRWRGRTTTHSLASGLDDYPRVLPLDTAELNVDLLCWMGVMTRSIKQIAEILKIEKDVKKYEAIEAEITENIEKFHWSEAEKAYCDVSVDDDDENLFACYKGYITLFPLVTKFIPPQSVDKLEHIIKLVADPEELWTDFGLRSISKSSEFYRTGENYWRSPIWININYLVVESMAHYHEASAEYASPELMKLIEQTYSRLRQNLIDNVRREWERTGFVWEQYDDETGEAKGAKNFLGWSSLVLLLMEMPPTLKK